ncbi:MAG: hypothetical protein AB8F74_18940 [Saprospiraceae bacterium]
MKNINSVLILLLSLTVFSCGKEDDSPVVDEDGLTKDINDLLSEENKDALTNLGFIFYGGANPPEIENEILVSPCVISHSTAGDITGTIVSDLHVKLYNQKDFEVTVDYKHGTQVGNAVGSYIVGEDQLFSVFIEVDEKHTPTGSEAKLVLCISGQFTEDGIQNIKVANLMLDNYGNTAGLWIPNQTGRLFEDTDRFSEFIN